jgi:hypothetical protein
VTEEKEVIGLVVRLLSNDGSPRPIRGNQLSATVKTFLPEFNPVEFHCRNLRDFLRKYAANEVMELGKAGMDVVYGLRSAGQQQPLFDVTPPNTTASTPTVAGAMPDSTAPLTQLLADRRVWKTFVTPESPFRLFLAPSTRRITVLSPGYTPDPSWIEVPRISADVLLQTAKDFIAQLPDVQQAPLLTTIQQPRWWIGFFDLLNTLGLKMRWIDFRRRRIAEEFERAMPTLPPESAPAQVQTKNVSLGIPAPADQVVLSASERALTPQKSLLRRIASDAVERMTDTELRALNLPLGYVVDALTTR